MDAIRDFLWTLVASIFGATNITTQKIVDNLTFSNSEFAFIGAVWGILRVVAVGMTIIYFLLEANRVWALEGRDLNARGFVAPIIKLTIALIVIKYSTFLVNTALNLSNGLISQIGSIKNDSTDIAQIVENATGNAPLESLSFFPLLLAFVPMLIFWLVSLVVTLVFDYKALVWKLEFILRIAITPIAFADVYSGQNANAIRWFKGLFAMALYAACFVLIPLIGTSYVSNIIQHMFDGMTDLKGIEALVFFMKAIISSFVVPIAEIGVLGAAKQFCREVFGV